MSMSKSLLADARHTKQGDPLPYARLLSLTAKWLAHTRYALLAICLPTSKVVWSFVLPSHLEHDRTGASCACTGACTHPCADISGLLSSSVLLCQLIVLSCLLEVTVHIVCWALQWSLKTAHTYICRMHLQTCTPAWACASAFAANSASCPIIDTPGHETGPCTQKFHDEAFVCASITTVCRHASAMLP